MTRSKTWGCPALLLTVFTVEETSVLQRLPATRLSLSRQSSSKPSLRAIFPSNFKASLPRAAAAGKGPATSQHDRGLLALMHPLSLSLARTHTWEKHWLDIVARKEKSHSCGGRCCRCSLILDGCFQVSRLTTSPHSFKGSTKGWKRHLQRSASSPGELAVIFLMCLLATQSNDLNAIIHTENRTSENCKGLCRKCQSFPDSEQ